MIGRLRAAGTRTTSQDMTSSLTLTEAAASRVGLIAKKQGKPAILRLSVERRYLILSLVLAVIGLGVWSFQHLPIDAVPDITNVQVQINTEAPGYTPLETEQRVTYAIETAMAGLPRLDYTRSLSRYGLSQVTVVFKEGTDQPDKSDPERSHHSDALGYCVLGAMKPLIPERLKARSSGTITVW